MHSIALQPRRLRCLLARCTGCVNQLASAVRSACPLGRGAHVIYRLEYPEVDPGASSPPPPPSFHRGHHLIRRKVRLFVNRASTPAPPRERTAPHHGHRIMYDINYSGNAGAPAGQRTRCPGAHVIMINSKQSQHAVRRSRTNTTTHTRELLQCGQSYARVHSLALGRRYSQARRYRDIAPSVLQRQRKPM